MMVVLIVATLIIFSGRREMRGEYVSEAMEVDVSIDQHLLTYIPKSTAILKVRRYECPTCRELTTRLFGIKGEMVPTNHRTQINGPHVIGMCTGH